MNAQLRSAIVASPSHIYYMDLSLSGLILSLMVFVYPARDLIIFLEIARKPLSRRECLPTAPLHVVISMDVVSAIQHRILLYLSQMLRIAI